MRVSRVLAVFRARNVEFWRDRSTLVWNFVFPVLVVLGFASAFSGGGQDVFKVARLNPGAAVESSNTVKAFLDTHYVQFIDYDKAEVALERLRHHQVDMVIDPSGRGHYWVNESAPKGYLLERILHGSTVAASSAPAAESTTEPKRETVSGRRIRYVDWLISGLLGMNIMFSALFGVGYVIVRYRKSGYLKRLKATPLTAFEFLSAQLLSRLVIIVLTSTLVYVGCHEFVHFTMLGSYLDLFIVMVLGGACLMSVGLVIAARVASEEFAGGLLNLISWPMMFLSGVWFSLEGASPWVKRVAAVFPLTQAIDAARAIMTEGATLMDVSHHLIVLIAVTAVCLTVGSVAFKWE